jgi:hypothetical protein
MSEEIEDLLSSEDIEMVRLGITICKSRGIPLQEICNLGTKLNNAFDIEIKKEEIVILPKWINALIQNINSNRELYNFGIKAEIINNPL